jgi:hypothetical protein
MQWPSPEKLTGYLAELQRRDPALRWFDSSGRR